MTIEAFAGSNQGDKPLEKLSNVSLEVIYHRIQLTFAEPRGRGDRAYQIRLTADNFDDIACAMMYADSERAIKAFGAALQGGIIPKPDAKEADRVIFRAPNCPARSDGTTHPRYR